MKKLIGDNKAIDEGLRDKIIGLGEYSMRKSYFPELQNRTSLLESILRTAPAGIGILKEFTITEANDFMFAMTGYSKDEIIGMDIRIFETGGRSKVEEAVSHLQEGLSPEENIETIWRCKDGKLMNVRFCAALLDMEDPAKGSTFTAFNISALKQTEQRLVESREYFAAIFNSINDGVLVIDADSGLILDVNETASRMTGYGKRELIEMPEKWLCGELYGCTFQEIFKQMNVSKKQGPQKYDWMINRENGDLVWVEMNIRFAAISAKERLIVTFRDISQRKNSEQALYFEKERLLTTIQSIGEAVIAADQDGKVIILNGMAEQLTGWDRDQIIGVGIESVFILVNGSGQPETWNPLHRIRRSEERMQKHENVILQAKNGALHEIAYILSPIKSEGGTPHGMVLVFRDIGHEKKREEEILFLSYHDSLTGLYNRRYFEKELAKMDEAGILPLTVIMGDVNGLKLINDVFGHIEGDKLLQSAAQALKKACRFEDVLARWGGDEFIILLPNTNEKQAEKICSRIHQECRNFNKTIKTSISLGYSTKMNSDQNMLQELKKAEDMMYKHKLLESRSLRSAIVSSIKRTLYEKSHESEEHAERLKSLYAAMGAEMGLSQSQMGDLELFGMLHDIGMIAIRDSIVNKADMLTEEEWEELRRHPEIGYRIAQASPELTHISELILSHHEWWDGSGYPRGLKGESIPLLARIFTIADTFDSLTVDKPYRKAIDRLAALKEIMGRSGTQFDPSIVEIFRKVITRG